MPAPLKTRTEVVEALLEAFRRDGYDGASLASLSAAAGLGRSSLYHHFPGGKEEMAEAVLDHADGWLAEHVVAPLAGEAPAQARVDAMLAALADFYDDGRSACLLERLTASVDRATFQERLARTFGAWRGALADALQAGGVPPDRAIERAEDAIVRIEGALVVAALGSPTVFARTVADLRAHLLDAA